MKRMTKATTSALVALAVGGLGAPAVADKKEQPKMTEVGMFVGGIDEKQAAKVGNTIKTEGSEKVLLDGKTGEELARIPADPEAAKARALRQIEASGKPGAAGDTGTAHGRCGTSYVSIDDAAQPDIYRFKTGFKVKGEAVDFSWEINVRGEAGNSVYNFEWDDQGPMWPDNTWTSGWKTDNTDVKGRHVIRLVSGLAILTNGRVCFSGHPNAAAYVR